MNRDKMAYKCGMRDALAVTIQAIEEKNVKTTEDLMPALKSAWEELSAVIENESNESPVRVLQ